jgi:hypothetical protein
MEHLYHALKQLFVEQQHGQHHQKKNTTTNRKKDCWPSNELSSTTNSITTNSINEFVDPTTKKRKTKQRQEPTNVGHFRPSGEVSGAMPVSAHAMR